MFLLLQIFYQLIAWQTLHNWWTSNQKDWLAVEQSLLRLFHFKRGDKRGMMRVFAGRRSENESFELTLNGATKEITLLNHFFYDWNRFRRWLSVNR